MSRCKCHSAASGPGSEERSWGLPARRSLARPRSLVLLVGVLGALLLVWTAPALALSQRGHAFSFSFGKTTPAEGGSLLHPGGVAVNESTGDVYVVDAGNNRVERRVVRRLPLDFRPNLLALDGACTRLEFGEDPCVLLEELTEELD